MRVVADLVHLARLAPGEEPDVPGAIVDGDDFMGRPSILPSAAAVTSITVSNPRSISKILSR